MQLKNDTLLDYLQIAFYIVGVLGIIAVFVLIIWGVWSL